MEKEKEQNITIKLCKVELEGNYEKTYMELKEKYSDYEFLFIEEDKATVTLQLKLKTKLMLGDNMISLKKLPDNSIDSIVTDPPYGLSFMGKKWDYDVPSIELWEEVFRVLKPGGHVLSFGGTRTYHRMVVNMEDAGFEIRDQIMWLYSTGFPKSHNIGKSVLKMIEKELEKQGEFITPTNIPTGGSALKPANEPICLARKPLSEKTIAKNVLKWGTGGMNIDGCRVGDTGARNNGNKNGTINSNSLGYYKATKPVDYNMGRFPANIILDEVAGKMLDEHHPKTDGGGASRFFYCAKVSKRERNMGLDDDFEEGKVGHGNLGSSMERFNTTSKNTHPTVKPVSLMRYLVRLITPPNGIVLDMYMGSGATGIATRLEGFRFVGMEMDEEYMKIAEARIDAFEEYEKITK